MITQLKIKSLVSNIAAIALAVVLGVPLGNLIREKLSTKPMAPLVPVSLNNAEAFFKNSSTDLIVFGDTKCPYCKEGVELLDSMGMKYTLYNIDQDDEAKKIYTKLNSGGVPVLLSRSQYITGFSRESWNAFLKPLIFRKPQPQ